MATKKNIQKEIIKAYSDFKLTENHQPTSIYQICQKAGIDEAEFYKHFTNFKAIEHKIILELLESSLGVLENSVEYPNYTAKEKLLSFYFTFFETLTLNRSIVLNLINSQYSKIQQVSVLSPLRHPFLKYFRGLEIEMPQIKIDKLDSIQEKAVEYAAWSQLLITIQFWIEDISLDFEKTDIFIEKSIRTSFDLIENNTLNHLLDFGKFVWKEKSKGFKL